MDMGEDDEFDRIVAAGVRQAANSRHGAAATSSTNRQQTARPHPNQESDEEGDVDMAAAPTAGAVPTTRQRTVVFPAFDDANDANESALDRLIRHWMNERHSPDILPAQEDLLNDILNHVSRQSNIVNLLRGNTELSEDEHMRITLVQIEIERIKFIVRSYVRTRVFKIEKFARYVTHSADIQTRLTAAELALAQRQARLTDNHFLVSVLQGLPEKQAHLDDTPILMPTMITAPDKDRPVFVHALTDCPPVRLPNGIALEMEKNHISLTPYVVVEHLVARGEAELV